MGSPASRASPPSRAVHGLDADDAAPGRQRPGGNRAPGQEAAAAETDDEDVERADLLEELERHRPLPGDDERIVVRMEHVEAEAGGRLGRDLLPILEVAVEAQHLGAIALGGRHLAGRRVFEA